MMSDGGKYFVDLLDNEAFFKKQQPTELQTRDIWKQEPVFWLVGDEQIWREITPL
jgi:hypothetical protein